MALITRRSLIARAALAATGAMMARQTLSRPLRQELGVQLWTVKEELARDFQGTLRALARLGFRRVEAAGWHGRSPKQFADGVRAAGLKCVSAHYGLQDLMADTEGRLGFARDVGVQYVIASSPSPSRPMDPSKDWARAVADAMSLADWRSNAEAMNRIGRRAREMGLRFGYHNHSAEFLAYERRLPMDEILRLTEPANVVLELDIGWVAGAGYDPVEVIRRYAPRIHLLHVKDLVTAERAPGRIVSDTRTTPIGDGTVDWPGVFAAARAAPVHSYFVEMEAPFAQPPLQGLEKSADYLRKLSI